MLSPYKNYYTLENCVKGKFSKVVKGAKPILRAPFSALDDVAKGARAYEPLGFYGGGAENRTCVCATRIRWACSHPFAAPLLGKTCHWHVL